MSWPILLLLVTALVIEMIWAPRPDFDGKNLYLWYAKKGGREYFKIF